MKRPETRKCPEMRHKTDGEEGGWNRGAREGPRGPTRLRPAPAESAGPVLRSRALSSHLIMSITH